MCTRESTEKEDILRVLPLRLKHSKVRILFEQKTIIEE